MEWVNPDENLLKREFLSDQHKSAYMLCRFKTAQHNITTHNKQQQAAAAYFELQVQVLNAHASFGFIFNVVKCEREFT